MPRHLTPLDLLEDLQPAAFSALQEKLRATGPWRDLKLNPPPADPDEKPAFLDDLRAEDTPLPTRINRGRGAPTAPTGEPKKSQD